MSISSKKNDVRTNVSNMRVKMGAWFVETAHLSFLKENFKVQ
jgi:hypothetical protein